MIEVEVRGKLTDESYKNLKSLLEQKGSFKGKHQREMYLLSDYPGFDHDPTKRKVDIRLRNTDGFCEIMVKFSASEGNRARREVSLALKDNTLKTAKEVLKALGCSKGLKMVREKEIYDCEGVEWSLVNCLPKNIRYFEVEKLLQDSESPSAAEEELITKAKNMGQEVLGHEDLRDFMYWLDKEVNVLEEL